MTCSPTFFRSVDNKDGVPSPTLKPSSSSAKQPSAAQLSLEKLIERRREREEAKDPERRKRTRVDSSDSDSSEGEDEQDDVPEDVEDQPRKSSKFVDDGASEGNTESDDNDDEEEALQERSRRTAKKAKKSKSPQQQTSRPSFRGKSYARICDADPPVQFPVCADISAVPLSSIIWCRSLSPDDVKEATGLFVSKIWRGKTVYSKVTSNTKIVDEKSKDLDMDEVVKKSNERPCPCGCGAKLPICHPQIYSKYTKKARLPLTSAKSSTASKPAAKTKPDDNTVSRIENSSVLKVAKRLQQGSPSSGSMPQRGTPAAVPVDIGLALENGIHRVQRTNSWLIAQCKQMKPEQMLLNILSANELMSSQAEPRDAIAKYIRCKILDPFTKTLPETFDNRQIPLLEIKLSRLVFQMMIMSKLGDVESELHSSIASWVVSNYPWAAHDRPPVAPAVPDMDEDYGGL